MYLNNNNRYHEIPIIFILYRKGIGAFLSYAPQLSHFCYQTTSFESFLTDLQLSPLTRLASVRQKQ